MTSSLVSAKEKEKISVLTIRVPHALKERIEVMSEKQGVSINQFALYAFTKQLSEIEDSAYYQQFIKNKTRQDLLAGFDSAMSKVRYRLPSEDEDWDKLLVAESTPEESEALQKFIETLPKKSSKTTRGRAMDFFGKK